MTDGKTDPPKLDPFQAMLLERIAGLENSIKTGHALLAADINGVVDGQNQKHGLVMTALANLKDEQAKQGRVLLWLKKAVADIAEALDTLGRDYAAFQEHVFKQFDRTSLRVVGSDIPEPNGNGHDAGE